jgi:hypothetical protein
MATVHFMSQNFVRLASVPLKPQLQTLAFDGKAQIFAAIGKTRHRRNPPVSRVRAGWVLNAPALLATAGQEARTAEWKSEACTLIW